MPSLGEQVSIAIDVMIQTITDPNNPVQAAVNFITAGYANHDPASDLAKGAHTFTMVDQRSGNPATITIGGVPTVASDVPLIVFSAHPTINVLEYNGPLVPGVYDCSVVYQKTAGLDYVIGKWQEIWR